MRSHRAGHHRGLSVDGARVPVHRRDPREAGAREHLVAVSGHHRVDPRNRGQGHGRVFHSVAVFGRSDAGMRQRHHHIRPRRADARHDVPRRGHDVARRHPAFQVLPVPLQDLRRHEAEHADPDRIPLPGTVDHGPVEQHIGRQQRAVTGRPVALSDRHVRADHRKGRRAQCRHQKVQPEVEFVVSQRCGVDTHRVHCRDRRVGRVRSQRAPKGNPVAQRVALQEVAVVEQQAGVRLGPQPRDARGGLRQPEAVGRAVGVIVVGQKVDVQIGRSEQPQLRLTCAQPA